MGHYWAKGKAELIRKELISRENLASKDDVRAQYELGMLFRYSRIPDSRYYEILRNDMKAKYWFKKAADQGDENSLKEYNKL
jgi:TPR repeat protein